ncbi:hypothetical protein [Salinimonas lutimaris]|uniref:hypothetical protein n=1 Tax=Salinimonas lutimaris TaxID=914153 RepID=UPI0010BF8E33|nr:hypothetical protein [Salinimonas lutimaris]
MLTQRGISLTGLLVALAISGLLLSAASTFAARVLVNHTLMQHTLRMEDELNRLIQLMASEIARAGYDGAAAMRAYHGQSRALSPFYPALVTGHHPAEPANSCVLFNYDKNHDGLRTVNSPAEVLGFRLRNHAVEYRIAGKPCTAGGWQDLSDPATSRIIMLSFILEHSADGQATRVIIRLEGHLSGYPDISRTLQHSVLLRNY